MADKIFYSGFTEKTSPTTSDKLMISDVSASNETKYASIGNLPINTATQNALNNKVDKTTTVNGKALSGNITLNQDDIGDGTTYKQYSQTEKTKLSGIEVGAEVNNISDVNATDLTDGGDTTLHTHDGRYYTESEVDTLLSGKQNSLGYNPLQSVAAGTNVTIDNTDPLNPVINSTGGGGGGTWGSITGILSDQTDLQTALDGKISGIQTVTTTLGADDTTIPTSKAVADAIGSAGGGDMLKSVYDTDNDGIVNQADVITNQGDLATLDSVDTAQITNHAVTNTKLADMNANTLKGRLSGNGTPQDISMADLPISTATQNALDDKQEILAEGAFVNGDKTKLDGIEAGAEVNNISDVNATDLTDGGDSTLHYHSSDRNRANHTGTQDASTITGTKDHNFISDYDTQLAGTSNTTAFTPTADYHPATKKYVDNNAGKVGTKEVDETDIADDKILVYKTGTGKYELEDKPAGGGSSTQSTFIAGENITAGNALRNGNFQYIDGDVITQTTAGSTLNLGSTTANQKQGQTFLSPNTSSYFLDKITIQIQKTGSPTDGVVCKIYESNKTTLVGTSQTISGSSITTSMVSYEFNFYNLQLSKNTTYFYEISRSGAVDSSNYYSTRYQNSNVYANGSWWLYDNSTGWSENTSRDWYFIIDFNQPNGEDNTKIYKTNASDTTKLNFIGFATNTATTGNNVIVDTSGVSNTQTGLTIGSDYYLSNTSGAISTTPGTNIIPVGKATNTTGIEILTNYNTNKLNINPDSFYDKIVDLAYSANASSAMSGARNIVSITAVGLGTSDFTATTSASNGYFQHYLPRKPNTGTAILQWGNISVIELEGYFNLNGTNPNIGFIYTTSDLYTLTSTSRKVMLTLTGTNTFQLNTGDGTTQSYGNTITATSGNSYMHKIKIVYTLGTDVKVYFNDILQDTKTTNLPTGGFNCSFGFGGPTTGGKLLLEGAKIKIKYA